jgi:spore coat protein U-like protein
MKIFNTLKSTLPAAALACLALGIAPTSAFAATTATASMAVSASVQATCIVSATAMAFGNYVSTAASTSTSSVSVTCTNSTPYTLGLDAGLTGTVTARQMKNGAAVLNYGLFTNATWTTNFATLASVNGTGSAVVTQVYGQIPAGQYVTPGTFTDTITATVTY